MGKLKAKEKHALQRTEAVELLKKLVDGLESGHITIGGDTGVQFDVADDVGVSIKGKVKRGKAKVSVSLRWMQDENLPVEAVDAGVPATKEVASPPAKKKSAKAPAKKKAAGTPAKKEAAKAPAKKEKSKVPAKKGSVKQAEKPIAQSGESK